MAIDTDKIDETVLALLRLTLHDRARAWKGHDWEALKDEHRKGMIDDPVGKVECVVLTDQGAGGKRAFVQKAIREGARSLTFCPLAGGGGKIVRASGSAAFRSPSEGQGRKLLQADVEAVPRPAAPDCMLMMWTPRPLVVAASALPTRWGWDHCGRPRWSGRRCRSQPSGQALDGHGKRLRDQHEVDHHLAARGKYLPTLPMWGSVLIAPVGEPSEEAEAADGDDQNRDYGPEADPDRDIARPPLDRRGWWYWGDAVAWRGSCSRREGFSRQAAVFSRRVRHEHGLRTPPPWRRNFADVRLR